MSTLTSYWWVILLAALVGAGALVGVDRATTTAESSTIRVGLTSEAVWPRFQSELESFANFATSESFIDEAAAATGADNIAVTTDLVEGVFVIELIAKVTPPELGPDVVTFLAQASIAAHTDQALAGTTEQQVLLEESVAELQVEIDHLRSEAQSARANATELGAMLDDEFSFAGESEFREASVQATLLENELRRLLERQATGQAQLSDTDLRLESQSEQLFITRDAMRIQTLQPLGGIIPVALAALTSAIAAGAWLIARDRSDRPVRTAGDLERALGVPVLEDRTAARQSGDRQRLEATLARARTAGAAGPLLLSLDESVDEKANFLRDALLDSEARTHPNRDSVLTLETSANVSGVLLAVRRNETKLSSIRRHIESSRVAGREVVGLIIT